MIWWCATHDSESLNSLDPAEDQIGCWLYADADEDGVEKPLGPCRMVEALLIVKENGEWPERVLNAMQAGFTQSTHGPWWQSVFTAQLDALASVGEQ